MKITFFQTDHTSQAAALFVDNYKRQRLAVPALPDRMENQDLIAEMIASRMADCTGISAVDGDRLVGFIGWYQAESFRATGRRGAYVPEWCHGALEGQRAAIYRLLYRRAAEAWTEAGCQVHAITLLASDQTALNTWFWNGFGLHVVDAVRPIEPICASKAKDLSIIQAEHQDAPRLAEIEAEHWQHYAKPPIYMANNEASTESEFQQILSAANKAVWMALDGDRLAAYLRFEPPDSAAVVEADDTIWIKGAFTRPDYRGRGAMPALLEAGLVYYRMRGYQRCAVDFESINPEAAVFWPRYFEPVCLSVVRVPEKIERLP